MIESILGSMAVKIVAALLVGGFVVGGSACVIDQLGKESAYARELKTKDAVLADERHLREQQEMQSAQYADSLAEAQRQISALQARIDAQRAALPRPADNEEIPVCPAVCRLPDYSPQS